MEGSQSRLAHLLPARSRLQKPQTGGLSGDGQAPLPRPHVVPVLLNALASYQTACSLASESCVEASGVGVHNVRWVMCDDRQAKVRVSMVPHPVNVLLTTQGSASNMPRTGEDGGTHVAVGGRRVCGRPSPWDTGCPTV